MSRTSVCVRGRVFRAFAFRSPQLPRSTCARPLYGILRATLDHGTRRRHGRPIIHLEHAPRSVQCRGSSSRWRIIQLVRLVHLVRIARDVALANDSVRSLSMCSIVCFFFFFPAYLDHFDLKQHNTPPSSRNATLLNVERLDKRTKGLTTSALQRRHTRAFISCRWNNAANEGGSRL